MNKWVEHIRKYFSFFFVMLGVCYLVNEIESWQSLLTDNKIQFAFLMTIGFLLINSSEKLFKKIKESL